jgi:hypothetical protein
MLDTLITVENGRQEENCPHLKQEKTAEASTIKY